MPTAVCWSLSWGANHVELINLSSDTATKPTDGMRAFMARAEVGDEQRREDPTVNALQDLVAEMTGKEAALFLPSGTMCNMIALTVQCRRGDAVVVDRGSHVNTAEAGGPAIHAGVLLRTIDGDRGVFTPDQIRDEVTPAGTHTSRTAMVSVENTTNRGGGKIWSLERLAEIRAVAAETGMVVHMDGARLMNAVVGGGHTAAEFAGYADTVWIDLSKGLGAPVGAVLAGTADFIEEARRYKHIFGGAMRQAGVIAAAGLYAFEHHVERLAEDHENCRVLEAGLAQIPTVDLVRGPVETNILFLDVSRTGKSSGQVCEELEAKGVRMSAYPDPRTVRAVTHLDVTRADCERAVDLVREVCA